MRLLLFIHLLFLWSCGALPLRMDSAVKPSRDPELEAVPEQNFGDYARDQSEVLLLGEDSSDKAPADAYEIYQNGGRDFIRQLFRAVRDTNLNEDQDWVMKGEWHPSLEGNHCLRLTIDPMRRQGLPMPRVLSTFPLLGLEWKQLTDPHWMNSFYEKSGREAAPLLEDWQRLILFESGVRLRGKRLKKSGQLFLEFTYKVVHEKGEALSLLDRDEWGTRMMIDMQREDPRHQRLLIVTEAGRGLYENSAAAIDTRHELLIAWDEEGPRSQFQWQLMAQDQLQAFRLLRDRQEKSITLRWQVNQNVREFKIQASSMGVCHGS